MKQNRADVSVPIVSERTGPSPLVINVLVTPNPTYTGGGSIETKVRDEPYVKLTALPDELRRQVVDTINMLVQGF
jgi:hypothetical protein